MRSDWRVWCEGDWHYLTDDEKAGLEEVLYGFVYIFSVPTEDGRKYYIGSHSMHTSDGWNYWSSGVKVQQHIADHGKDGITRNIVKFFHDEYAMLYAEKRIQIEHQAHESPKFLNRIAGDARIGTIAGTELREYMSAIQKTVDRSGRKPNYSGYGVLFETTEGIIWFDSNKTAKDRLGISHCAISNWIAKPNGKAHRKPRNKAILNVYRCTRHDAMAIPDVVIYGEEPATKPAGIFEPHLHGAGMKPAGAGLVEEDEWDY